VIVFPCTAVPGGSSEGCTCQYPPVDGVNGGDTYVSTCIK
jgi:hypothetical protein